VKAVEKRILPEYGTGQRKRGEEQERTETRGEGLGLVDTAGISDKCHKFCGARILIECHVCAYVVNMIIYRWTDSLSHEQTKSRPGSEKCERGVASGERGWSESLGQMF